MEAKEKDEPPDQEAEYRELLAASGKLARDITRNTRNGDDVDDLAAEAAEEVFYERERHPDRLTTRDQRERFMRTVIKNRNVNKALHDDVHQRNEGEIGRGMDDDASPVGQPEKDLDMKIRRGLVAEALSQLNPHYAEILVMRYFEDLKPGPIAAALGIPPGMLRQQLWRAIGRMKMNEALKEYYNQWVTES